MFPRLERTDTGGQSLESLILRKSKRLLYVFDRNLFKKNNFRLHEDLYIILMNFRKTVATFAAYYSLRP